MLEQYVSMFISLFVVIDPIGLAPMFGAITRGGGQLHRRRMAIKGTILATAILLVFAAIGDWLLRMLGISFPAFKIAGGALLFLIAIDMVFARQSGGRSATEREEEEGKAKEDVSVFPLAFPLIAGPGALATILIMVSEAHGKIMMFVGLVVVVLLVLGITLGCLLLTNRLMKLLGETGANVIGRLFGVILAALAVQFVVDGIRAGFFH
ncbi:MAG: NAAT family transporter [Gammaproteobacteria bacterium]|nr:MarC family protein [Gammaproteobacteria bacterium]MDE1887276.1 NAAT family transporter [Gammaproteobacteria bacterium]MDE2023177.1 NAAT family transporter [Gammaproteobacteria bacterium]